MSIVVGAVAAGSSSAAADSIASLKAQASHIAAQVLADGHRLDLLGEEYYQAQVKDRALQNQVASAQAALAATRRKTDAARADLRNAAIDGFVNGGTSSGLSAVITSSANSLVLRQEYLKVTTDSVSTAITRLHLAEDALAAREARLRGAEASAHEAVVAVASIRSNALAQQASAKAMLANVKGHLATLVAQAEAQAQAAASAAARPAKVQPPPSAATGAAATAGNSTPPVTPPSGSGAGMTAVRAAYSQLGVPYVWAGETPGVGFDCSGLTAWAWGQAGVYLPHSATAQYNMIEHVPMSAIEPGDLIFWGGGGIEEHVAIYIGGGDVISAPYTGTVIQIQPIWYNGLVGAGRP